MEMSSEKEPQQEKLPETESSSGAPISPEATANVFSRWSFFWLDGLFRRGNRQAIEEADLYEVLDERKATTLGNAFQAAWDHQHQRAETKGGKPSLGRAIAAVLWKPYFVAFLVLELGDVCQILNPIILRAILQHVKEAQSNPSQPPPIAQGYGLAVGMLLLAAWMAITYQQFNIRSFRVGIQARTILTDAVFRKATVLSARSHLAFPDGKIINLMSTDVSRIDTAGLQALIAVACPIFIIAVIGLLIDLIGPSALIGAVILLFANPIQAYFMGLLAPIRKEASQVTDARMKLTTEIVQGIKVIKFFAWEPSFLAKLAEYRAQELQGIKRILRDKGFASATSAAIPVFASALTFVLYAATNHELKAEIVFPVLSYFTILRVPMQILPNCYAAVFDALVAIRRIEKFLLADEISLSVTVDPAHEFALSFDHADFIWEQEPALPSRPPSPTPAGKDESKKEKKKTGKRSKKEKNEDSLSSTKQEDAYITFLRDIHLHIPRGSLVAVVGPVGAGKSSLLQAMVGSMTMSAGHLTRGSTVSYAPQTPWIQNATIQDNILFRQPLDPVKYQRIVTACCMEKDLAMFPDGDQTEIGERGVNLSGGQKARLSLARSVYFDADMVVMDDPLSAVDAHVGKHLWHRCVLGELRGRTRVIATHQLHVLPDVDYIVCMKDGKIDQQGTYNQLMNDDKSSFRLLMEQYGGEENVSSTQSSNDGASSQGDRASIKGELTEIPVNTSERAAPISEKDQGDDQTAPLEKERDVKEDSIDSTSGQTPAKQIVDEERAKGAIDSSVYIAYFKTAGWRLWGIAAFFYVIQQVQSVVYVTVHWPIRQFNGQETIIIYVVFAFDQLGMGLTATALLSKIIIVTTRTIHDRAMENVLRAPLSFFDTTPAGRILNRFSKDVSDLDNIFWETINDIFVTALNALGTVVLTIIFFPWLTVAILPIGATYYLISVYYLTTSREVKRLDSTCRSYLFTHFAECLHGMTLLRAFKVTETAIKDQRAVLDRSNRPYYIFITAARWLSLRVNLLGTLIQFGTAMMIIGTRFTIDAATAGLVMSYLSRLSGDMNWVLQKITMLENNMNSAERLNYYIENLPSEPPAVRPDTEPAASWPSQGTIEFSNVSMCYRAGLPRVLRNVSFVVQGGQKIGVVGRTGAGKSSLIQAFFRLVELDEGQIFIDGIETGALGTADLRSRIAIIPQDPVLFQGTFRYNLDPLGRYTDDELWRALETSDLKNYVAEQDGGLDAVVAAHGENLSVGQRQLVCLSRALLAKSKVVVLDEATASVDLATDALIQKAIREDFATSTVVTIAHRLNTIIDYNVILVMEHGEVAEFDTPRQLLERPNSLFGALVDETGAHNAALLRTMAAKL
ncbi:hypothetical protein DFQ27_008373 [Actinomortierella ambigua]|uniref:P-loop containing nucleoside triphosphate hydrolase protein n=1 Tax=Actinomortierella ambigua TaxID=1343610 RepID=A0A9P6QJA0_9FUNG|nr:hypothetical protein DFQ27_008373 [Actinomortierella ambigua]